MEDCIVLKNDIDEEIRNIRYEVFCVEQNVSEKEEWDGLDKGMIHVCYYRNNKLIGYCRAFFEEDCGHVGRVVVLKEYRKHGIGSAVVKRAEEELFKSRNVVKLNAQVQAIPFYEKIGYTKIGNMFLDANIPHYAMFKNKN